MVLDNPYLFGCGERLQSQGLAVGCRSAHFAREGGGLFIVGLLLADEVSGLFQEMTNRRDETGDGEVNELFARLFQLPIDVFARVHHLFPYLISRTRK